MRRSVIVLALLARVARAEEPARPAAEPAAAASVATRAVQPGQEGVFRLATGGTLAGEVISLDAGGDVIRLRSGELARLPAGSLVARVGDYEAPGPVDQAAAGRVRLLLKSGATVEGQLVSRTGEGVTVRVDGRERHYPADELRGVFEYASLVEHRGGQADPGRLRHVHAPAALGPARRELVVSGTAEGLTLDYGLAGWLSATAGLSTPIFLDGRAVAPAYVLGADVRRTLLPWLHASVGVRGLRETTGTAVFLTAAATAGSPDTHLTLYAGPPIAAAGRFGAFDGAVLGLGATSRVSARFAAVLEAWASLDGNPALAGAASARFIGGPTWSLDLGALGSRQALLPWFALTWRLAPEGPP